jgi:hypothetical protein
MLLLIDLSARLTCQLNKASALICNGYEDIEDLQCRQKQAAGSCMGINGVGPSTGVEIKNPFWCLDGGRLLMFNILQVSLAVLGLLGTGIFGVERFWAQFSTAPAKPSPVFLIALYLGLLAWIGLSLLRRDIVATVGLTLATILLFRHYGAFGRGDK